MEMQLQGGRLGGDDGAEQDAARRSAAGRHARRCG